MSDEFNASNAVKPSAGYDVNQLKGKSVVITGGGSGLGEEFAKRFAKAGAFVTIGDVSEERGKRVVSEIGEDKAAFAQCDVLTWSDQVRLFKTAISRSPSKYVDVVVANAGISGQDQVWKDDAPDADSDPIEPDLSILRTNLIGVTYTAKLAVHYLSRNPPDHDRCLIMTASVAGYLDQPGSPQYNASKWGVRGIMRSLRRTMPTQSMRVNIIAPWFTKTNIIADDVIDRLESKGIDFATKGDAASAVLHFASERSINGRACAIVPRNVAPEGYMDLGKDDNSVDDIVTGWQNLAMKVSHRIGTR
ncbi:uncharacterized protein LTR77_003043 [Saxophila tyrrhenica]|uniref:Uncharacterized protein n=1 Tax=Saxophila tyrrhenica TaxID=1690608 RepID=A0AAV9PH76_9PEZI|nr:hypothetical protein LTR77_003043 [Saxophila tyrrhenica]